MKKVRRLLVYIMIFCTLVTGCGGAQKDDSNTSEKGYEYEDAIKTYIELEYDENVSIYSYELVPQILIDAVKDKYKEYHGEELQFDVLEEYEKENLHGKAYERVAGMRGPSGELIHGDLTYKSFEIVSEEDFSVEFVTELNEYYKSIFGIDPKVSEAKRVDLQIVTDDSKSDEDIYIDGNGLRLIKIDGKWYVDSMQIYWVGSLSEKLRTRDGIEYPSYYGSNR